MAVGYCEESLLAEPILDQLFSAILSNQANRASSRSLSKISAFSIRVLPADWQRVAPSFWGHTDIFDIKKEQPQVTDCSKKVVLTG